MITILQANLLRYIDGYIREHEGVAPSYEEMRADLPVGSKSEVHRLLTGLEERGMIRRLKGKSRAIEVLRLPGQTASPRPRVRPSDIARHIAAQDWCAADAATVLASIRELRS